MLNRLKAKLIAWVLKNAGDVIYTSKGNVPVKALRYETSWHFEIGEIKLREVYYLGDEIVKEGWHVYKVPDGTALYFDQGNLNQPNAAKFSFIPMQALPGNLRLS